MSMLLSSLINGCRNGRSDLIKPKTSDVVAQLADLAIIVSAVAVGTLLMFGVLGFGLSGPLTIGLQWGLIGLGAAFIAIDVGTWVTRALLNKNTLVEINAEMISALKESTPLNAEMIRRIAAIKSPTAEQKKAATEQHFHLIWGTLYLGDGVAAAEYASRNNSYFSIDLPQHLKYAMRNIDFSEKKINYFDRVMTLCPLASIIQSDKEQIDTARMREYERTFEKAMTSYSKEDLRDSKWFYLGCELKDKPEDNFEEFATLVYNCTEKYAFLNTTDCQDYSRYSDSDLRRKQDADNKKSQISRTPVDKWFQLAFEQFDAAMQDDDITMLVHCQKGVSVSATLLAAYLINRFEVSPEEAVAFLEQRRACVEPAFINQLEEYSKALAQSRLEADYSESSEYSES